MKKPPDSTPSATVLAMMRGYWISQGIFVVARLGIADHLTDGPKLCTFLAERTGVPERPLRRLMRAMESVGIFSEISDDLFGLTELGDTLRSESQQSLRSTGIVMGEVLYQSWNELMFSIEHERPGFQ